ncbi:rhomboid family intramembrane serine protease [Saprospiraceae bacterium]|nr:rhomboid family intramembrane serine protease [Saprospiraceae bacterium]
MTFNITLIIIIITCITSYFALEKPGLLGKLAHTPYLVKKNNEYYRFVSSGFVHSGLMHLAFNMFVLYNFGGQVEAEFNGLYGAFSGKFVFVLFYILNIIAADLGSYFKHKDNPRFSSIGASGAVSGVLFVYIVCNPWAPLHFLFFPFFGIPAFVIGIAYLAYSSYEAKRMRGKINHNAHFYGALFGVAFLWLTQPEMIGVFIRKLMAGF